MSTKQCILHIGYPKAGSTTLQSQLFPNLTSCTFLGKHCAGTGSGPGVTVLRRFRQLPGPPQLYRENLNEVVKRLTESISETNTQHVIISKEDLLFQKGVTVNGQRPCTLADAKKTASVLRRIFAHMGQIVEPKIVIVVRRQGDILPSTYAMNAFAYINAGYYNEGFENFVSYVKNNEVVRSYFNYDNIIRKYIGCFGSNAVGVFPMEGLFDEDTSAVRRKMCNFTGIPFKEAEAVFSPSHHTNRAGTIEGRGKSYNPLQVGEPHLISSLIIKAWSFVKPFIGFAIDKHSVGVQARRWVNKNLIRNKVTDEVAGFTVSDDRRDELTTLFEEGNRRLSEKSEIDFAQYGYY